MSAPWRVPQALGPFQESQLDVDLLPGVVNEDSPFAPILHVVSSLDWLLFAVGLIGKEGQVFIATPGLW